MDSDDADLVASGDLVSQTKSEARASGSDRTDESSEELPLGATSEPPLEPVDPHGPPTSTNRRRLIIGVTALVVIVLDQLTKHWALGNLERGIPRRVMPGLNLTLSFNAGSAFSLGSGGGPIIGIIATIVVGGVLYVARRQVATGVLLVLGLVVGGAVGNLLDRAFRAPGGFLGGHVVDFLQLPHWPIFNVADMAITCGAIAVAIMSGSRKFGWTDG